MGYALLPQASPLVARLLSKRNALPTLHLSSDANCLNPNLLN